MSADEKHAARLWPWRLKLSLWGLLLAVIVVLFILAPTHRDLQEGMICLAFVGCPLLGAILGRGKLRRMLLYAGIGGSIGVFLGDILDTAYHYHDPLEMLGRNFRDGLYLLTRGFGAIVNFVIGMAIALNVYVVQRIAAKVKAKELSIRRVTIYAIVFLLAAFILFVLGCWLVSVIEGLMEPVHGC